MGQRGKKQDETLFGTHHGLDVCHTIMTDGYVKRNREESFMLGRVYFAVNRMERLELFWNDFGGGLLQDQIL